MPSGSQLDGEFFFALEDAVGPPRGTGAGHRQARTHTVHSGIGERALAISEVNGP
jgi:hypothetical protein